MITVNPPPGYYDEPLGGGCLECADACCIDGVLEGRDGDGRETSDDCTCKCHDFEQNKADAEEASREGA